MGMREYKKFKREQELKESETISLLNRRIDSLENELKQIRASMFQTVSLTEDEKKKLQVIQDQKTKPEDFIKMFTEDLQEFDPNA